MQNFSCYCSMMLIGQYIMLSLLTTISPGIDVESHYVMAVFVITGILFCLGPGTLMCNILEYVKQR